MSKEFTPSWKESGKTDKSELTLEEINAKINHLLLLGELSSDEDRELTELSAIRERMEASQ